VNAADRDGDTCLHMMLRLIVRHDASKHELSDTFNTVHIPLVCISLSISIMRPPITDRVKRCTPSICLSISAYDLFESGKPQKLQIWRRNNAGHKLGPYTGKIICDQKLKGQGHWKRKSKNRFFFAHIFVKIRSVHIKRGRWKWRTWKCRT